MKFLTVSKSNVKTQLKEAGDTLMDKDAQSSHAQLS